MAGSIPCCLWDFWDVDKDEGKDEEIRRTSAGWSVDRKPHSTFFFFFLHSALVTFFLSYFSGFKRNWSALVCTILEDFCVEFGCHVVSGSTFGFFHFQRSFSFLYDRSRAHSSDLRFKNLFKFHGT